MGVVAGVEGEAASVCGDEVDGGVASGVDVDADAVEDVSGAVVGDEWGEGAEDGGVVELDAAAGW